MLKEIEIMNINLHLEDWEMDPEVRNLCDNYSKNHLKRIVKYLQAELKQ
jgi:hypothetical protein